MISRSNSASAPKIWKISLPPLVVVSMFSVRLLTRLYPFWTVNEGHGKL
jgi:hypothetical protein